MQCSGPCLLSDVNTVEVTIGSVPYACEGTLCVFPCLDSEIERCPLLKEIKEKKTESRQTRGE